MFDLKAKRELNSGMNVAFGRGFELAITPVFCGGIGWLVDQWVGTGCAFTLAFAIVGVLGVFVKLWLGYDLEMKQHEAALPKAADPASTPTPEGHA